MVGQKKGHKEACIWPNPPCDIPTKKRLIAQGVKIEQKPWQPTVRFRKIAAEIVSPGPACVSLPSLMGSKKGDSKKKGAPAFSFGGRHFKKVETVGPGPGPYDISGFCAKGKNTPPAPTLKSRRSLGKRYQTPAPIEYNVNRALKVSIKEPPAYSLGMRPPPPSERLTPAPNVYKIPSVFSGSREGTLKSAPAYSLAGRVKPMRLFMSNEPGPANYDGISRVAMRRAPAYSFRLQYEPQNDNRNRPGPADHCPEKYVKHKSVPAPSFSIQHSLFSGHRKIFLVPDRRRQLTSMRCRKA